MTSSRIVGLLAESFVHVGSESGEGVIDLPVAREAATDYPYIPGSGLKGALRDWARQRGVADEERLFGRQDNAGQLLVSDARLLLLPVRSLHGAYCWVTCPHLLERYQRDCGRMGLGAPMATSGPARGTYLGAVELPERLILEERSFGKAGELPPALAETLAPLIAHETTRQRLPAQVVLLHDDDFAWFARYGLPVQARNVLDQATKTSKNLWYEESLPPDTLLYSPLCERGTGDLAAFLDAIQVHPYLQAGGNETVGQGWFALALLGPSP